MLKHPPLTGTLWHFRACRKYDHMQLIDLDGRIAGEVRDNVFTILAHDQGAYERAGGGTCTYVLSLSNHGLRWHWFSWTWESMTPLCHLGGS